MVDVNFRLEVVFPDSAAEEVSPSLLERRLGFLGVRVELEDPRRREPVFVDICKPDVFSCSLEERSELVWGLNEEGLLSRLDFGCVASRLEPSKLYLLLVVTWLVRLDCLVSKDD